MRIHVPPFRRILDWVFKDILRKEEQYQLSGASWFLLGCALTIHLFSPVIATASIIFLVMGVLCSALITRPFGNSVVTVGAGTEGHKSIEGCATMFVVCFLFGCGIFHQSYLREYPVFIAALVATLAEYYEPFGISYNVSIPVLTAVALTLGFERTISCGAAVVVEGAAGRELPELPPDAVELRRAGPPARAADPEAPAQAVLRPGRARRRAFVGAASSSECYLVDSIGQNEAWRHE